MKLDIIGLGIAGGIVLAIATFVVTLWSSAADGGRLLSGLTRVYPGYSVSVLGAFLSLIYSFIYGFVGGLLTALFYNKFSRAKPEGA